MSWKCRFKNSFPLSVRTQIGCLCIGLEYLGFSRNDLSADVTAVPDIDLKGIMCKNFEKNIDYRHQILVLIMKFSESLNVDQLTLPHVEQCIDYIGISRIFSSQRFM